MEVINMNKTQKINMAKENGESVSKLFVGLRWDKNRFSNDFNNFCKDKDNNFNDDSNNIIVSLSIGIGNNINVYIVEVPNETAPSIQGFAKPPA